MTRDAEREAMASLLEELGGTADEVAAALAARGVTGRRGESCHCPIAALLSVRAGVMVPTATMTASASGRACELPPACRDFVRRFDLGMYPHLEEVVRDA